MSFSLDNNLEAKIPIAGTDSTRKVSIIDNFGIRMSYNFLAEKFKWSNLNASLRLKLFKSTVNLSGTFETYLYDENGQLKDELRIMNGKGLGRFTGTSASYPLSISNETLKNLFKKGDKNSSNGSGSDSSSDREGTAGDTEGDNSSSRQSMRRSQKDDGGDYDPDGYLIFTIPWNISFSYSVNLGYDRQNFNKQTREYPYKFSQTLGFTGSITPTKAWNLTFGGSYDFDIKRIANVYCSITRQMHCWSMSASIVPIGPYQNYSFSIAINSDMLKDVKYQQSSNFRDAISWGNK
jgi:hypothetical protein